jgi:hypothetical protein
MGHMSSSSVFHRIRKQLPSILMNVWMLCSTIILIVVYLSIRTRLANYATVFRWIKEMLLSLAGISS